MIPEQMMISIERLRKEKKISIAALCRGLSVRRQTYYDWIDGKHYPNIKKAEKLMEFLSENKGLIDHFTKKFHLDLVMCFSAQEYMSELYYVKGMSIKDIAIAFQCSTSQVSDNILEYGKIKSPELFYTVGESVPERRTEIGLC